MCDSHARNATSLAHEIIFSLVVGTYLAPLKMAPESSHSTQNLINFTAHLIIKGEGGATGIIVT